MDASTFGLSIRTKEDVFGTESARATLSPLPSVLTHGLGAVATFGFISFISSAILFFYLSYKLVWWQLNPVTFDGQTATAPNEQLKYVPQTPTANNTGFLVPNSHLDFRSQPGQPGYVGPPIQPDSFWRRLRKEPPNQFLVLIYNLLFADIQQASAFLLNVQWLVKNGIVVETSICWAQGWFVSTGDMASSVFITAIAVHTYMGVVHDYRLPTWAFYAALALLWSFVYGLAILGVIITKNGAGAGGLYVRAGAWCWINAEFQNLRLYLRYLWIFLALVVTSALYVAIFLHIHKSKAQPDAAYPTQAYGQHYLHPDPITGAAQKLQSASTAVLAEDDRYPVKRLPSIPSSGRHPTFLLYPIIYVICTAPLAAGRIASMAGREVSLAYFCFAGSLIASAGWLDVALYSTTRRSIVFAGDAPPSQDTGLDTFAFMRTPVGRKYGNVVYVQGGEANCHENKRWHGWNDKALAGGRLRGVRGGRRHSGNSSLKGFGAGAGEVMGMAIQCDVVATITVEQAEESSHEGLDGHYDHGDDGGDDTSSLNSRMCIIKNGAPYNN